MIKNLQSILTQSNLGTEAPIFVVYSKQEVCVDSDFDYNKVIYVNGEDELGYSEFEELEEKYCEATDYRSISIDSNGEQVIPEMPEDPCSGEDFDPDDWEKRYVKFVDKFEKAFFIRQNAEDYIESMSHRLNDPYIFVESAYRNYEWQAIRKFLIDTAQKQADNNSWKTPAHHPILSP